MNHFKDLLISKRKALGLTSKELSKQSSVSESLLSGLQSGNRRIAEKQASRIASALGLKGQEKSDFIFMAMNESTQRLLESSKAYPVELLNYLPVQLQKMKVTDDLIRDLREQENKLIIFLESNNLIEVETKLLTFEPQIKYT
jgi:transcriptional regulator with XRE-family HTH domain